MYHSWLAEQQERAEFARNLGIFVGSFSNPQMADRMQKSQKVSSAESTEEYDQKSENILRQIQAETKPTTRRRRIKG